MVGIVLHQFILILTERPNGLTFDGYCYIGNKRGYRLCWGECAGRIE